MTSSEHTSSALSEPDDASAQAPPRRSRTKRPDPLLGKTIAGKFQIESLIGAGGIGRVYKANHLLLSRAIALKVLRAKDVHDPDYDEERERLRFEREAQLLTRIRHPSAVMIYDYGFSAEGNPYLAMELLEGMDLEKLIASQGRLHHRKVIPILRQVLSALIEAHAKGIVHRDLKPSNIFIRKDRPLPRAVKVLDFGAAKIAGKQVRSITMAGELVGTWFYMAPEQAMGEDLDGRTDLYGLAMVAYEMLTGDLPFEGDNEQAYLMSKMTGDPRPFDAPLNVPEKLQTLIMSAMSREVSERPDDALTMLEMLNALDPDYVPEEKVKRNTERVPVLGLSGVSPALRRPTAQNAALSAATTSPGLSLSPNTPPLMTTPPYGVTSPVTAAPTPRDGTPALRRPQPYAPRAPISPPPRSTAKPNANVYLIVAIVGLVGFIFAALAVVFFLMPA